MQDFGHFLRRCYGTESLLPQDLTSLMKSVAANQRIRRMSRYPDLQSFASGSEGMRFNGWTELPDRLLDRVSIGSALEDQEKDLCDRRLCAISLTRVTSVFSMLEIARQVIIMRTLCHENVCRILGYFLVEVPDRPVVAWILTEFADAGTLDQEIKRYDEERIPESGARFYAKQIVSAVAFLHHKSVTHNDLHLGRLLLQFGGRFGCKKILVSGFSRATVGEKDADRRKDEDVRSVMRVTRLLILGLVGPMPADERMMRRMGVTDQSLDAVLRIQNRLLDQSLLSILDAELDVWLMEGKSEAPMPQSLQTLIAREDGMKTRVAERHDSEPVIGGNACREWRRVLRQITDCFTCRMPD